MITDYRLRLTEEQHTILLSHLFPPDGKEAVALLLCGRRAGDERHVFTTREVILIPHELCDRSERHVAWPTDLVSEVLGTQYGEKQAIVKVHSHPGGFSSFSALDDESDHRLFDSISNFLEDGMPHASAIMLPDGKMFGRVLIGGQVIAPLSSIVIVGDDLKVWTRTTEMPSLPSFTLRHAQAFGKGTTGMLRSLSAAVVGCSGTGSIVVEQLARLGIGRLVLVDPDVVEEKNLSRILNSGKEDAYLKRPKVHVLASAIARMGFGHEVICLHENLTTRAAVLAVAECDVAFGCMDGVEGRHLMNRLATFYSLPYFDVGVRLDADGMGGIAAISGAVHYLQPGRSSLLSRGVYSMDEVEAEEMQRVNQEHFEQQREAGYVRGVAEDRPAVISVNTFFASLCVNEFLARLHPYRNRPNSQYAYVGGNLAEMLLLSESETDNCSMLKSHLGGGDVEPLLKRPILS